MMTDRQKALMRVQTYGFALDEAILFLDTHTNDKEALAYYHKKLQEYNNAINNYVANFGPLDATQVKSYDKWTWTEGCMPWEVECNVEI